MKQFRKRGIWLTIVIIVFTMIVPEYVMAEDAVSFVVSDGSGVFYIVHQSEYAVTVSRAERGGVTAIRTEAFQAKDVLYAAGRLLLILDADEMLLVTDALDLDYLFFIPETDVISYCAAADRYGNVYLVTDDAPDVVKVYNTAGLQAEYHPEEIVNALYADEQADTVYAVVRNGITAVNGSKNLSCETPLFPVKRNGRYCTDSSGRVFLLDSENGFVKLSDSGYSEVCTIDGIVYVSDGEEVIQLDGRRVVSRFSAGRPVTGLYASGSQLAVFCGETVKVIGESDFTAVKEQSADDISHAEVQASRREEETSACQSVGYTEESSGEKPDDIPTSVPQSSSGVQESPESDRFTAEISSGRIPARVSDGASQNSASCQIKSSTYAVKNDMICGIPPGTTIPQFRNNMEYEDYQVHFRNHNGKSVSSGTVGTGWKAVFSGEDTLEFYLVVDHDVTGEGNSNRNDIYALSNYLLGKSGLNVYELTAADSDGNGMVNACDFAGLVQYVFG